MHPVTGYFFFTNAKTGRKHVIYSTLYSDGWFASMHDCTGLTEQQARGRFLVEHSWEVDVLIKQKAVNENKSKIILT